MMLTQNAFYQTDLENVLNSHQKWNAIDGHSFLVIGASGMVGSFLIDVLMKRNTSENANIHIYAMGRSREHLVERFGEYMDSSLFDLVVGDVTQPLPENLDTDYILHAASNTHPRAYATDPVGTIMTNLMGTQNVLEHVVKHPTTRVMFLSSVEVYGENRGDVEKFDESYSGYLDSNTLRAGYPESKRVSEALCQAYIAKYDLDIVIPRLCRIFGPTMRLNDSKASSQFILNAVHEQDIVLKSDGHQNYSYAYVADVVSALLFLMTEGVSGEAYNVAVPALDTTLKQLATTLAEISGKSVIMQLPDKVETAGFSKATKALLDASKLNALGWQAQYDLKTALRHTVRILQARED
ncbi:NAD-dependent epimerase/dehydratase family protein [Lacticaseibacillus porcinae]|uniref:NAD-dependent epimerase/dehydratase family protein n=1 Tax=Lacticaseibacillus porcinae TaxID=1123687 RepID=UPI003B82F985